MTAGTETTESETADKKGYTLRLGGEGGGHKGAARRVLSDGSILLVTVAIEAQFLSVGRDPQRDPTPECKESLRCCAG